MDELEEQRVRQWVRNWEVAGPMLERLREEAIRNSDTAAAIEQLSDAFEVDKTVRESKTTRSAFTRKALREALDRLRISELERKHRLGYKRQPVREGEFDTWDKEQAWPDS